MPRLLAVATVSLLVSVLGGCFLLPSERGPHAASPDDSSSDAESGSGEIGIAEVGDCWEASFEGLADWVYWEGDAAVDCGEDHQSITYFVAMLDGEIEGGSNEHEQIRDELAASAATQCRNKLVDLFEWHPDFPLLSLYFFLPADQQWDDGERWVRCDVAVMELGSSVWEPEVADLPAKLSDLVEDYVENRKDYAPCFDVDEEDYGVGPYEAGSATYADCSASPTWRPGPAAEYPAAADAPFPGVGLIDNFATQTCSEAKLAAGDTLFIYSPDELSWADGDHWVECWITTATTGGGMV